MTALDRTSPLPLWAQLADELRQQVVSRRFGERLPTETELVDRYHVSRNTVRQAMRQLQDEGLVERQRGRGTTVVDVEIERALPGLYSLARTIQGLGLDERSDVIAVEARAAGESHGPLQLAGAETEVIYVERVRFAGDEPLALDRSWLPADQARPLLDLDLSRGSLYDALRDHCRTPVTGGSETIVPMNPKPADRSALRLPRGHAAFRVERVAESRNRAVEWRISLVRGDRYRFVSSWP